MNRARALSRLCFCVLMLAACGGDGAEKSSATGTKTEDAAVDTNSSACVPDEAMYNAQIAPLMTSYCVSCHGDPPTAGAPFSLDSFERLRANNARGEPVLEHVVHVMRDRIMPPPSQKEQPSDSERDVIVRWASCGEESLAGDGGEDAGHHAGPNDGGTSGGGSTGGTTGGTMSSTGGAGLMASRDPYVSPTELPTGTTTVDLTLAEFTPSTTGDTYESRSFTSVVNADAFIRRFEPIVDDARVVHHLTLRFRGARTGYLYVWAPGGTGFQFPEGGIRVTKGDTISLEIHYHNGSGAKDVRDSSGVRLYLAAPGGTEYGIANLASWGIAVPAKGTGFATSKCTVGNAVRVLASLPHMHEIGDTLTHFVTRKSTGAKESLIELSGWDFHTQRAYAVDMDLAVGDVLDLKCTYVNPNSFAVTAGPNTTDEMCFDFLYVTPPTALSSCNDKTSL